MKELICTICVYLDFFMVCKLRNSSLRIMPLISDHLGFMTSVDIGFFSCWDIKKGRLQFLVTFLAVFFWSVNCANQVYVLLHILNMENVLFEFFWYLDFWSLAFLSILSLLFPAIFPDLEMLQFWSVNHLCQICKLCL